MWGECEVINKQADMLILAVALKNEHAKNVAGKFAGKLP